MFGGGLIHHLGTSLKEVPHTKNYVSSITLPKIGRMMMDGKAQGSRGQGENCNSEEV